MEEKLTMDDYATELEASLRKVQEGDVLTGTVIGVSDTEVTVDLKSYTDGIIRAEDYSEDPSFSIKNDVHVGDEVTATVLRTDDGQGHLLLSRKAAADDVAWKKLQQYLEEKTVLDVKVGGVVKGGVVAYVEGIRGFIPASKLSLSYVENLEDWLNKEIQVQVITVEPEKKRLVLSARELLREKAAEERRAKISNVQVGLVTEGKVESIQPYGAFIDLGDGLSGLVQLLDEVADGLPIIYRIQSIGKLPDIHFSSGCGLPDLLKGCPQLIGIGGPVFYSRSQPGTKDIRIIIHLSSGGREQLFQTGRIRRQLVLLCLERRQVILILIECPPGFLYFPLKCLVLFRTNIPSLKGGRHLLLGRLQGL